MTKFGPKLAFLVNLGQAMQAYSVPCWSVGWWLWRAGCISQDTYLLYMFRIYTAISCLMFLRPNSFLTVEVHPTDRESRSDISICASSLPKDKVIFLMPKEEVEEEDHEEDHRIPEPRAAVTGGVEPKKVEQ